MSADLTLGIIWVTATNVSPFLCLLRCHFFEVFLLMESKI